MDKALVFGTKDPRFESCQCDFAHSPQIQAVARSHRFFLLALLRNWTLVPIPVDPPLTVIGVRGFLVVFPDFGPRWKIMDPHDIF